MKYKLKLTKNELEVLLAYLNNTILGTGNRWQEAATDLAIKLDMLDQEEFYIPTLRARKNDGLVELSLHE